MRKYNPLLHGSPARWDIDRKPAIGGDDNGSSTTVQEIPAELKPLATAYTNKAMGLSEQPFSPYTDQRYADLTTPQLQGIDLATQRALTGSATNQAAEGALNQFIQGGNTNPYLDAMYGQAAGNMTKAYEQSVLPGVNSSFSLAGRYGSNAHQTAVDNASDTLGQNLGNLATSMYGGAYDQDRARQMQAIGMAPQFGNLAYQDASQLLNAGQILQDQAQNPMDFAYQQFSEEQNKPYKDLAAMAGVFGSNLGGTSKTTSDSGGK
jgi:hypothetical protein